MKTIISLINITIKMIGIIFMMPIFIITYLFASINQIINDEIESEN